MDQLITAKAPLPAGSLFLAAGDSSGTAPPSQGGKVTVVAGTASPGGERSSLQLLDTSPSGTGGDILLSSTSNIVLQSPVLATASSTFGTAASDTFVVNAAATFEADTSLAGALAAHGDITLGDSNAQRLTVNAQTTFGSSSGPITVNAPVAANSDLAVSGTTVLGNTIVGSNSSQSLTVNGNTIFSAPIAVNAPVTANAPLSISPGSRFFALGDSVLGSNSSNTMTVFATANFSAGMSSRSLQLYSISSVASNSGALGFQRQANGGPVISGTTLGSILFSGFDGTVQAPTAQIRSQHTVSSLLLNPTILR